MPLALSGFEPTTTPVLGENATVLGIEIRNQTVFENRERVKDVKAESQNHDKNDFTGLNMIKIRSETGLNVTSNHGIEGRIVRPGRDKDNPSAKNKPAYWFEIFKTPDYSTKTTVQNVNDKYEYQFKTGTSTIQFYSIRNDTNVDSDSVFEIVENDPEFTETDTDTNTNTTNTADSGKVDTDTDTIVTNDTVFDTDTIVTDVTVIDTIRNILCSVLVLLTVYYFTGNIFLSTQIAVYSYSYFGAYWTDTTRNLAVLSIDILSMACHSTKTWSNCILMALYSIIMAATSAYAMPGPGGVMGTCKPGQLAEWIPIARNFIMTSNQRDGGKSWLKLLEKIFDIGTYQKSKSDFLKSDPRVDVGATKELLESTISKKSVLEGRLESVSIKLDEATTDLEILRLSSDENEERKDIATHNNKITVLTKKQSTIKEELKTVRENKQN